MKKITALLLALIMVFALAACSASTETTDPQQTPSSQTQEPAQTEEPSESPEAAEPKILYTAVSFVYATIDPHKEYYGWQTSLYGLTETLFKMGDDSSVQPCLAESAEADGLVWTVTLNEGVCFSNGNPVTADMVIRNLQRVAEVNSRFAYLADYEMAVIDDKTFTITTADIYPTMLNDLASPELAILDLDGTSDFDTDPVSTGPFVISEFEPEGTVTVARNDNYWNGEVKLDGAVFYYMQDDESKLMAMQGCELDGYSSVTAAALEIYQADPDTYNVTIVPATRLQFYFLNKNTLSDSVRAAINQIVDKEAIAAYLSGTVSPAVGPFSTATAYGQVTTPAVDVEAAKALIEADGYILNDDGLYAKDGDVLSINISYYAARSLDTIALLIQEQLKNAGIDAVLTCEEDPDATYISTGDFDLALYCMIADKAGDPYYFINSTLREGSYFDICGFDSDEAEALIDQLQVEPDEAKRAELANQIVQIAIDDNAFGYVGLFNRTTVMRNGVSGFSENCPFSFYSINANTDKN